MYARRKAIKSELTRFDPYMNSKYIIDGKVTIPLMDFTSHKERLNKVIESIKRDEKKEVENNRLIEIIKTADNERCKMIPKGYYNCKSCKECRMTALGLTESEYSKIFGKDSNKIIRKDE